MRTIVYLIRHSIRFDMKKIEKYLSFDSDLLKSEKNILSVEGEYKAKRLSELEELNGIDRVYASNCVRTLATAKYLLDKQNLKITLDERLDERRVGIPNEDKYPNWFKLQFEDENYKTVGGESQKEVRERFSKAMEEILNDNDGKRVIVFAHGYAIIFFLMNWLKLINVDDNKKITLEFNNEIVFDKVIDAPEIFKVEFEDKKLVSIENIKIDY